MKAAVTLPRIVAASAVLVAAGLVVLARAPTMQLPVSAVAPSASPTTDEAEPSASPNREPFAAGETPAAAKLRELAEMSETFRNTTFLIAIRDSGFVCHELLGAYGGVNNSTTWTATCSQMLAYTVSVASTGALHVEPMLQHLDQVSPAGTRREPGGDPVPRPQRLPPQRR
jgi:hypothetical protein